MNAMKLSIAFILLTSCTGCVELIDILLSADYTYSDVRDSYSVGCNFWGSAVVDATFENCGDTCIDGLTACVSIYSESGEYLDQVTICYTGTIEPWECVSAQEYIYYDSATEVSGNVTDVIYCE